MWQPKVLVKILVQSVHMDNNTTTLSSKMIREVQKSPLLGILQSGSNFSWFLSGQNRRWGVGITDGIECLFCYVYLVHMPETGGLKP